MLRMVRLDCRVHTKVHDQVLVSPDRREVCRRLVLAEEESLGVDGIVYHVPVRLHGVSGRGRQGQEERGLQQQAGLIRKELLIVQRGRTSGRMKEIGRAHV